MRFGALGGVRGSAQPPLQRVWLTSSFFLTRLMQGRKKYDFKGVARWPARAGVHLPSLEAVIVPVNMLLPDHWGLIALDLRRREAHFWDSWFRPSHKKYYRARLKALVRWVGDEMAAAAARAAASGGGGGGGAGGAPAAQQGWTFHVHSAEDGVPQQHNDYDCGACERGGQVPLTYALNQFPFSSPTLNSHCSIFSHLTLFPAPAQQAFLCCFLSARCWQERAFPARARCGTAGLGWPLI